MSKIKINLDRIGISSEEILKKMNFEDILVHQKIMAKPFYKSAWFFGVSGLATVSLIASSIYSLNVEGDKLATTELITESNVDLNFKTPDSKKLLTKNQSSKEETNLNNTKEPIEEKITLNSTTTQKFNPEKEESSIEKEEIEVPVIEKTEIVEVKEVFSFMDLYPRISGKLNGKITKKELLNDEGLVTNSDVRIISFQLHLVDASGGKVFESKGNTLNSEMKTAINSINVGEEIYFEKIDGQSTKGEIVRLSPLRYVLLN